MENVSTDIIEEIEEARARIADLLLEIDDIVLQVNPRIEAEYATKIGYLENDLLKWQIEARKTRRRYTLAQARANAGESFSADEFEDQLEIEFIEWHTLFGERMSTFLKQVERATRSKQLSPVETRKLKELHRILVKRLHPDLHPSQSEFDNRYFVVAQTAYECGNLIILESLVVATEGTNEDSNYASLSSDEAFIEHDLVLAQERVVTEQLEELKNSNPYALKEKLENTVWVIEQANDLKQRIEEQKAAAKSYKERFQELLKRGGDED